MIDPTDTAAPDPAGPAVHPKAVKPTRDLIVLCRGQALDRRKGLSADLEALIADHRADFGPDVPERRKADRAIFDGARLVAVIKRAPDGSAEVTRFRG